MMKRHRYINRYILNRDNKILCYSNEINLKLAYDYRKNSYIFDEK